VSACVSVGAEEVVVVDLERCRCTLRALLAGAPLPAVEVPAGTDASTPWIRLEQADGSLVGRFQLYGFAQQADGTWLASPREQTEVVVLPGEYRVVYERGDHGLRGWPDNERYVLQEEVSLTPGERELRVDVPRAELELSASLAGGPLPTVQVPAGQEASTPWIRLHDPQGRLVTRHQVYGFHQRAEGWEARPRDPSLLWVVPGRYEAIYERGDDGLQGWPDNARALLDAEVEIGAPRAVVEVDVPRTEVTLQVTLDGEPLPDVRIPADEQASTPWVRIEDRRFGLVSRWQVYSFQQEADGWIARPRQANTQWLIPGSYDLVYERGDEGLPEWPTNQRATLAQAQVVRGPQTELSADVPRSLATLTVELDGAALETVHIPAGGEASTPWVVLQDTTGAQVARFQIYGFHQVADGWEVRPRPALQQWVVPGSYRLLYERGDDGLPQWPVNTRYLLDDDIRVAAPATALVADLRRCQLTLEVTLASAPLEEVFVPAGDEASTPWLLLQAQEELSELRYQLYGFHQVDGGWQARPRQRVTQPVLPGEYAVIYEQGDEGLPGWPINERGRLRAEVNAAGPEHAAAVDIPVRSLEFDVQLDGGPLPEVAIPAGEQASTPWLRLLDAEARRVAQVQLYGFAQEADGWMARPRADDGRLVLPGTYEVCYERGDEGLPDWPTNELRCLGCVELAP